MIVSGGHILAIDGVETDGITVSGNGVDALLGLPIDYAESVRSVSGKLDILEFDSWSAKTESWDIDQYLPGMNVSIEDHVVSGRNWMPEIDQRTLSSAFGKTTYPDEQELWSDLSGTRFYADRADRDRLGALIDEKYVAHGQYAEDEQYVMTSDGWRELFVEDYSGGHGISIDGHVVSVSADYQYAADMSAYYKKTETSAAEEIEDALDSQSAWVDDTFQKIADVRTYSAGNEYVRVDGYEIYGYDWSSATSALPDKLDTETFEEYSAWAEDRYEEKNRPTIDNSILVGSADGNSSWIHLDTDKYGSYLTDNSGSPVLDEAGDLVYDESAVDLWSELSGVRFGAERAVCDRLGNVIDESYVTPADLTEDLQPYATSSWVETRLAEKLDVSAISYVLL